MDSQGASSLVSSYRPPWPGGGRVVFYLVLTVLAALGWWTGTLVLGLFLFIVPGFVFMAASFLWLYLPIIDWPMTAWRRTGRWRVALGWFAAALVIPVGAPLTINALPQRPHPRTGDCSRLTVPLLITFNLETFDSSFGAQVARQTWHCARDVDVRAMQAAMEQRFALQQAESARALASAIRRRAPAARAAPDPTQAAQRAAFMADWGRNGGFVTTHFHPVQAAGPAPETPR